MVSKIDDEELMEWIERSCEDQHIPVFSEEACAISAITMILRSA